MSDVKYFEGSIAPPLIIGASCFSILWGIINAILIKSINMTDSSPIKQALDEAGIEVADHEPNKSGELEDDEDKVTHAPTLILSRITWIGDQITKGAISFLNQEYLYLGIFAAVFAIILGVTVDTYEMGRTDGVEQTNFPYTAVAFLVGAGTSILAGYIGMRIAVYTNTRTTFSCCKGDMLEVSNPNYNKDVNGVVDSRKKIQRKNLKEGFFVAFRGAQVLGFVLVGLALLILEVIVAAFRAAWFEGALEAQLKANETA